MSLRKPILIVLLASMVMSGCKILYPNRMLQTPKDYNYTKQQTFVPQDITIELNDVLQMFLYSNDGFKLVDISTSSTSGATTGTTTGTLTYPVEFDGTVKLPLLGRVVLSGLTIRQAQNLLEEKYGEFFVKPFILLKITNRKILVFPGADGSARSLALPSTTTTLIDAIANVGGIPSSGKAYRIKVVRGATNNPQVFLIDFSTLEGLKQGNMVLQSNDIVYVDIVQKPFLAVASLVIPYLTIFNTVFFTYITFRQISR